MNGCIWVVILILSHSGPNWWSCLFTSFSSCSPSLFLLWPPWWVHFSDPLLWLWSMSWIWWCYHWKELASYLLPYQPGFRKEVIEHIHLCQTPNPKPEGRLSESTESRNDRPCSLSCTSVILRLLHSRRWQHTAGSAWTVTRASVLLHTHHWGLINIAISFFFEWTNCGSERLSDLLRIAQCTSLSWVLQVEVWPQLFSKQWF